MGGKTNSAGLPQTLLLKRGAFGNIFSCTFPYPNPISSNFQSFLVFLNLLDNLLQTVHRSRGP